MNESGYKVAKAIAEGKAIEYVQHPEVYVDGPDGNKGGVGILRTNKEDQLCLVMKYSAQGMGHGHYDKLAYSLYSSPVLSEF